MTRRDETCDTRVERLEPRRLFTAGDLIDSDSLVGRSDVVAQELILTTNDQLLAFARSALTHNVTVARVSRDGTLDETFGDGGWIEIDVRRGAIEGNSTVFSNPDTGGFGLAFNNLTNGGVLMFDADGTRDTSFDGDGRWDAEINVHPDFRVRHAQLQSDGKVVIAGTERVTVHHRRAVVRRLNADGSPDASFGGADGAVDLGFAENVADLVVDDDDRITVVAHVFLDSNIATDAQCLVRLMPDGRHDASFGGGDGTVDTPAGGTVDTEVVVGGDGSTYVNRRGVVRRYDESGRLVWTRSDVALTGRMVIDGNDKLLFVRSEGVLPNGSQSIVTRLFPDRETDRAYRWSGTTPLTAVPEAAAAVAQGDELVVLGNTIFSGGTPVLARLEAGPGLRAYVSNQGTLVVRADEAIDLNDVIEIDRRGGDDRIVVRSAGGVAGIDWVGSFAPSRVKRIDVRTFGGDDSVIIGPNVKGAHVDAGAGDDSVTGGDGGDLLFGGDGTDNLLAGAGDDRLFGDGGIDFLFGEDGTDTSDNDPLDTRNDIEQLLQARRYTPARARDNLCRMSNDTRGTAYLDNVQGKLRSVESTQADNFRRAGAMMADAYEQDRLIHVYGGGGHTVMMVCEMFFRAGGLANVNPVYGHDISPLCQATKYIQIERTTGYGARLIRYYDVKKDDLLIVFHNIGYNPTTIDAVEEAKQRGAKIIAVSSTDWQQKLPRDHHIRHPNKKHLFEYADLKIDDANPYGDADYYVEGFDVPVAPTSTIVDAYVAHRMVIEAVAEMKRRGLEPPVFRSANLPGGDEFNAKLIERYRARVKDL